LLWRIKEVFRCPFSELKKKAAYKIKNMSHIKVYRNFNMFF
jgi:hypothetical protein